MQEQADRCAHLEKGHIAEREMQIRKLAREIAEKPDNGGLDRFGAVRPSTAVFSVSGHGTSVSPYIGGHPNAFHANYIDVRVELHPGLRGDERILIAEEIIREQLDDAELVGQW